MTWKLPNSHVSPHLLQCNLTAHSNFCNECFTSINHQNRSFHFTFPTTFSFNSCMKQLKFLIFTRANKATEILRQRDSQVYFCFLNLHSIKPLYQVLTNIMWISPFPREDKVFGVSPCSNWLHAMMEWKNACTNHSAVGFTSTFT